jgi:hypothetical protein
MAEYLLEVYLPATDDDALADASTSARAGVAHLVADGCRIDLLHAIYVPEDQTCFYVFEADSADEVLQAAHLAHLGAGRVVAAVTRMKGTER